MKKWFKRVLLGLLILLLLVIIVVNVGIKTMRFTDLEAEAYFEERGFEGRIDTININGRDVKIVSDMPEESDSILLIFVHGAPGTWDAFKEYVTDEDLNSRGRIVSIDRPGYGGSGHRAMPSISEQSEIVKEIIRRFELKRNILIGHSYGGPIVASAGLDLDADAVIMIAPLVDPDNEPLFWYSYFSYWKLTSWLLPSELVVAGSEKFAHAKELEKMEDKWQEAKGQFVHIHGLEDALAPGKENLAFSNRQIPKQNLRTVVYDDKGHLVIWTDYDLMKQEILRAINNL